MEHTETPAGKKPHSNPRMAAYRQRMKDRGLKQVQFWAIDTKAPGFMEELKLAAAAINESDKRDGIYEWMEAVQSDMKWD